MPQQLGWAAVAPKRRREPAGFDVVYEPRSIAGATLKTGVPAGERGESDENEEGRSGREPPGKSNTEEQACGHRTKDKQAPVCAAGPVRLAT